MIDEGERNGNLRLRGAPRCLPIRANAGRAVDAGEMGGVDVQSTHCARLKRERQRQWLLQDGAMRVVLMAKVWNMPFASTQAECVCLV